MKSACCRGLDVLLRPAASKGRVIGTVSLDFLGADAKKQYLVLHVDDPEGLVAHEKGSGIAYAAMSLVPEYVENQIYSTIKDELKKQFKEKGSDVDVTITQSPPKGEKPTSDLKGGIVFGMLLTALGYGGYRLIRRMW